MGQVLSIRKIARKETGLGDHDWLPEEIAEFLPLFERLNIALNQYTHSTHTSKCATILTDVQTFNAALAAQALRQRQNSHLPMHLVDQPCWDMLLHVLVGNYRDIEVSTKSGCRASGCHTATALRWLIELSNAGLIQSVGTDLLTYRTMLKLSDAGLQHMVAVLNA